MIAKDTVLEVNTPDSGSVTSAGTTETPWLDEPWIFTGTVASRAERHRPSHDRLRRQHNARLYPQ